MTQTKLEEIVNKLLEQEEVLFHYNNYYIYIQEKVDGGYEGDIYESEEAFDNGENPLDGGICDSIVAIAAIEFFKEICEDLKKRTK
jgi:hypothetical protein